MFATMGKPAHTDILEVPKGHDEVGLRYMDDMALVVAANDFRSAQRKLKQMMTWPAGTVEWSGSQFEATKSTLLSTIAKALTWVLAFRWLAWPSVGICPQLMRQLYNAVVVPKMIYVANVWYTPVNKQVGGLQLSS